MVPLCASSVTQATSGLDNLSSSVWVTEPGPARLQPAQVSQSFIFVAFIFKYHTQLTYTQKMYYKTHEVKIENWQNIKFTYISTGFQISKPKILQN